MTVFQSRAYRELYRTHFGRGKSCFELATPNGAKTWLQSRGLEARRLEMWGEGIADCGGADCDDSNAQELWGLLRGVARDYDGAVLNAVSADSTLVEFARRGGWAISDAEVCPTLPFPGSFDAYVKSLGKNMREQIKRYPKRLEKNFAVETELARSLGQVEEFLTQLFELHGKRWRARVQTGVLVLPWRQRFHRALCHDFLERDWLRLWRLKLDGRAACVLLSYFWGGKFWFSSVDSSRNCKSGALERVCSRAFLRKPSPKARPNSIFCAGAKNTNIALARATASSSTCTGSLPRRAARCSKSASPSSASSGAAFTPNSARVESFWERGHLARKGRAAASHLNNVAPERTSSRFDAGRMPALPEGFSFQF